VKVVFLAPRREDGGHRDLLWALCRARWERDFPDWPVVEGHHTEGPFNRAAAINRASALADVDGRWDVAIIIDSDVMVKRSQVLAAVERAKAGYVTWAHRRWREFHDYWTHRTLKDHRLFDPEFEGVDLDVLVAVTNPISWSCCVAVPRETFDAMSGFDERFVGWGFEDGAWAAHVRGLYKWDRIQGDVINLWHPRSGERIVLGEPASTASVNYVRNALLGRRYMVAAIRDHKAGDQLGEERLSDEMVEIHVRNLVHDDGKFVQLAAQKRMPEVAWRDWWPTLEELKAGWDEYREAQRSKGSTVTMVVMSGGTAESWPERSAYLRRSLASLTENVTGPVIQRVVYSGWDESLTPELEAIAGEFGFYVAGGGEFGHTGTRKRMWTYLGKRAKGDYIFGSEDDFVYPQPVDLVPFIDVLRDDPKLAQIALLRDAFYQDERETGGVLGWPEPAFTKVGDNGTSRLEHRLFWTNNPSLFRKSMTDRPWPEGYHSETVFGKALLRDDRVRFAFWGDHQELTKHIGEVRAGHSY
jgi:hypothetical protein